MHDISFVDALAFMTALVLWVTIIDTAIFVNAC